MNAIQEAGVGIATDSGYGRLSSQQYFLQARVPPERHSDEINPGRGHRTAARQAIPDHFVRAGGEGAARDGGYPRAAYVEYGDICLAVVR